MLRKKQLFYTFLFWIGFLLLNSLLFAPTYLVDTQLHIDEISSDSKWWTPFLNGNTDLFYQLCGDFLLLLLPLLFLKKGHWMQKIYFPIAALIYLLFVYYNFYLEGYKGLYAVHPIFENDWVIIKEIMPTFLREISVKGSTYLTWFIGFLVVSIFLFGSYYFFQKIFIDLKKEPSFWAVGFVGLLWWGLNIPAQQAAVDEVLLEENDGVTIQDSIVENQSNTLFHWIYPNIEKSATLDRENHLAHLDKRWIYDFYKNKKLQKKPNIFLLFVESYGGVASLSDHCGPLYEQLIVQLEEKLDSAGWNTTSNYSKSTVIGGRSWLAMTTAMIGARVEDQIQYSELIKNRHTYPHMVDFFNRQGYQTYRTSTMRIRKSDMDTLNMITIPNQFWKFDHRYFFPDIPYKGYQYDLYGGIPHQYTLGYVTDELLKNEDQPFFCTLITMNSHGPWKHRMPPIVDNWRTLNTLKKPFGEVEISSDMHIFSYWIAIEYQLKMLTNYLLKQGRDDSIYIIIGDHNPGGLEYKLNNRFNKWATPIHIISRDSTFTKSFQQHGFTEGMAVDTSQFTIMRHMGLYSLLTRQLLENYGEEEVVLPEYLPWGLRF